MEKEKQKALKSFIIAVSILVPVLVAILFYVPSLQIDADFDFKLLPKFHAFLNGTASLCLIAGIIFIKQKKITAHKTAMLSAFVLSAIFLVSYVVYHSVSDSTTFGGEGAVKYIYYFILLSHILLSIIILPLVLFTIFHTLTNNIQKHRKIAKFTFPIWLYVTISGVLVYLLISPYY